MALRIFAVALAVVCCVGIAHAEEKPWVAGISEDKQNAALKLYETGNEFFEKGQYKQALPEYEKAIALWDHPGIRYNAAVCLFNLDRAVEAYENMLAALKYGEDPLGKELYTQGLNYKKLLSKQVAEIEVITKDAGASVSLDGKPMLKGPGSGTRLVAVSEPHEIVASKPGYQTKRHPITSLPPGEKTTIVLELELLEGSKWRPWAIVAVGAVIGGAGGWLVGQATSDMNEFERAITACGGCVRDTLPPDKRDLDDTAKREWVVGLSLVAVGAATIATGVVLVLRSRGRATVSPMAGSDRGGVTFSASW